MGININDLAPVGANLFSDSESFMGNIRSLSEDELKISGGWGYGGSGSGKSGSKKSGSGKSGSKKSGSKKSGSGSGAYGCGCGYGC
jgi:hypothetical protein